MEVVVVSDFESMKDKIRSIASNTSSFGLHRKVESIAIGKIIFHNDERKSTTYKTYPAHKNL